MRRVLNQAANAAVKGQGDDLCLRVPSHVLAHAHPIGAVTRRLCRLIWKTLHERVRYEQRGPAVSVGADALLVRRVANGYRLG